jgi:queuine tRNA-ribosyltransferase subunit QTRTD1
MHILVFASEFYFLLHFNQVKPSDYMELISSMKPDLWASLADEVPAWVNEKRNKTSVDRTLRWLDACIALDVV